MNKQKKKILSLMIASSMVASAVPSVYVGAADVANGSYSSVATLSEDETKELTPAVTYINAGNPDTNYATAGSVLANISKISGGKFTDQNAKYGGSDVALIKIDTTTVEGNIKSAKLVLTATCVASGKNSQVNIASTATDWDPETVTWNTMPGDCAFIQALGYADSNGNTFELDISDAVKADEDGILSYGLYTSTGRQQAITGVKVVLETTNQEILKTNVTVNNVVGDTVIKSYTIENIEEGAEYAATNAQLGYKVVDGKYYVAKADSATKLENISSTNNVLNIEFEELADENVVVYEDFANIADTWGFTAGKDGSVVLGNGLKLTQIGATSGDPNAYGYYYSDVKDLGDDIKSMKQADIVFKWQSDVEGNKNRKNAIELRDSEKNIIFGIASQAGKGSTDTLEAGITYNVGAAGNAEGGTNIAGSGWASGNSGVYTVALHLDFTGEKGKVSGTIKGGVANADVTIPETEIAATNLAEIVASDIYSAAPQTLYLVEVMGEIPPAPVEYNINVADTTNGTVTTSATKAVKDTEVTITATPDEDYAVDTIKVTTGEGEAATEVPVTDGKFIMPEGDVTVTVTFKSTSVDPKAVIDFTNRSLAYEAKGGVTVFEVTDAETAGATALAAAGAENVLKLGSSQNGRNRMFGYKADLAKKGLNTVAYGGQATMSFKLEPMQIRADKEASIELSFADSKGNVILPITVGTGKTAGFTVNGQAATGIAYGNYYVVKYTMDFDTKKASVTIDTADGTNCLTVSDVDITANNLARIYRADSDWKYGYLAIDDITLDATDITVPGSNVTVAAAENGTVATSVTKAEEGAVVAITATPDKKYEVGTIKVTTGEGEATTEVPVTDGKFTMPAGDVTVTVTFNRMTDYNVTVAEATNGTVTTDVATAVKGEEVTITATPAEGYKVDTIKVTTGEGDTATEVAVTDGKFTMPEGNVAVAVTFKQIVKYNVTIADAENGTVTTDVTTAENGDVVTITATPSDGFAVDTIKVTTGEGEAATEVTVTDGKFTMPAGDVTITVTFKAVAKQYNVTIATVENGTVKTDVATAAKDTVVTITAAAANGFELDTIKVTTGEGEAATEVTVTDGKFTMPEGDVTVTVTFKVKKTDTDAVIDFTNRSLTCESKGSTTVFEVTDAATAGATALAAAGAENVLKLGSSQNGGGKMLGYKADFAKEGVNTVVYSGQATMSFKLEPMQVRADKEAAIELSFADIKGNKILPITVGTGATPGLTVNGQAASGITYGKYYVVKYTMDFATKKASVTIDTADGTNCLTLSDVDIAAENITQLYRADSDWTYGYLALDDIKVEATEVGVPVFYSVAINTERYAKLTTSDGAKYFADVNGKIEIPLQKPNTTFDYTISKVGYNDVTGTIAPLTGDVEDTKPMTKSDENVIFVESEFGNAEEAYVSIGGSRNDDISLGAIELPEVSEVIVDFDFAGFGGQSGQQKTWFINTDAGELVGIQISDDGLTAWTGWTGHVSHNQSSDIGAFTSKARIGDIPSGAFTVKFVIDTVNKAITVSYNDTTSALTYDNAATTITGLGTGLYRYNGMLKTTELKIVKPDPTFMQLAGDTQFAKIAGKTVTRAFTKSETIVTPDEVFTWTLSRADEQSLDGITVDNGVVSVTDTAIPGTVTLTATGSTGKTASIDIKVEDFAEFNLAADGPKAFNITDTTGTYKLISASDNYGDNVMDLLPAAVWTSSDENVVTVDAATGVVTVVGKGDATITATITNGTAVSTISMPVTVGQYYIITDATGDETVIDVSDLTDNASIVGYQVTTSKNGAIVSQTTVDKVGGGSESSLVVEEDAVRIVAEYTAEGAFVGVKSITELKAGDVVDMTTGENEKVLIWNSLGGMAPVVLEEKEVQTPQTITVNTTGADKVEVAPIYNTVVGTLLEVPSATYNVTATVGNGRRCDLYVNDQMLINNINQGSDNWTVGRIFAESTDYTAEDIVIAAGYAKFNLRDDQSGGATVKGVKLVKAPSIVNRATRVYVIGDSLTAKYYGDAPEGQEGLVRTGWGDTLQNYISGAKVTNLGNSGAWATGMLGDAFTNVLASAKAGDIVVWESGYNDRNHGGADPMKAAMTEAANKCKDMGVKIFFVTPNASSHDYREDVVLSADVRALAEEINVPLIDLAKKSFSFLSSKYGTEADAHTVLQAIYNNTGDTLHSSYNAANCWAAIVAQGLRDEGLGDIVNSEFKYTYNDGTNDIEISVNTDFGGTATDAPATDAPAE